MRKFSFFVSFTKFKQTFRAKGLNVA